MQNKEDKDMFADAAISKKSSVRKPKITKNKFANMSKKDWQEANEQSKENRGISSITYRDIFRG